MQLPVILPMYSMLACQHSSCMHAQRRRSRSSWNPCWRDWGEVLAAQRSTESQLSALGAISSAAYAAGGGFKPYAPAVLPLLRQYMGVTEVGSPCCPSLLAHMACATYAWSNTMLPH